MGKFEIYDHGRWRSFNGRLFLFSDCLIVTKIVGKELVFRKKYSCDAVKVCKCINGFSLYYGNRVDKKCDFIGQREHVETWLKLLKDVIVNDITDVVGGESLNEDVLEYAPTDYEKVNEFRIYDHTLDRKYCAKVFLFDKFITYAEVREGGIILRGCYPFDHVGIVPTDESFTLFYDRRQLQECDFMGKPELIKEWLDLIHEQISKHYKGKVMRRVEGDSKVDYVKRAEDEESIDTVECSSPK